MFQAVSFFLSPLIIVFFTVSSLKFTEAAAARGAGMLTVILRRPGNASLSEEQKSANVVVDNFSALSSLKCPE